MKNINTIKHNIVFSLIILAILSLGVITIPSKANAQYGYGGYVGSINSGQNNNYQTQTYYSPTPTPVYVNNYETIPASNTTNQNTTTTKTTTTNSTNTSVDKTNTSSNLSANAIFGSNSFVPSRLIQWVMIAILILFIVILVRRIYGGREKYHATPLKHS